MRRYLLQLLTLMVLVVVVGCSAEVTPPNTSSKTVDEEDVQRAKLITIDTEVQGVWNEQGNQKVVVYIRNGSDKTFYGTCEAWILDADTKDVRYYTTINADGIAPGGVGYKILWVAPAKLKNAAIQIKWTSGRFE